MGAVWVEDLEAAALEYFILEAEASHQFILQVVLHGERLHGLDAEGQGRIRVMTAEGGSHHVFIIFAQLLVRIGENGRVRAISLPDAVLGHFKLSRVVKEEVFGNVVRLPSTAGGCGSLARR